MVYKWYILPIGGLYATYHLLGEPETTIDCAGGQPKSNTKIQLHGFWQLASAKGSVRLMCPSVLNKQLDFLANFPKVVAFEFDIYNTPPPPPRKQTWQWNILSFEDVLYLSYWKVVGFTSCSRLVFRGVHQKCPQFQSVRNWLVKIDGLHHKHLVTW